MSKLKPNWVKTDIPKDKRIKLWRIMKDNPTYQSRNIAFNESEEFTDEEKRNIPISRDTFKLLSKEVLEMPVGEVRLLPEDLQVWIEGLRVDLQGKLLSANRMGENDSSIIKDKERHFEAVWQLAREWSKQLYYFESEDEYNPEKLFPTHFTPTDAKIGKHIRDPIGWDVRRDAPIKVSFKAETDSPFGVLRAHLLSKELWEAYEALKSLLAESIKQAREKDADVWVTDEVSQVRQQIKKELERLLAKHKHRFPGKCPSCP